VSWAKGDDFQTNCCRVHNAPAWATPLEISNIAARIEEALNWNIRRIKVYFHDSMTSYNKESGLNFATNGFYTHTKQSVHFAPNMDRQQFEATFGHELVHVIFAQKYKNAIPRWLEEGLANFIGSKKSVDYKWLNTQFVPDVTGLVHPQHDATGAKLHYQLSTATAEMIAHKCNMNDLLMLSTGKRLENYLSTFCKIKDVNLAVREWIVEKSKKDPK
jgi:hypothetical protein